ncbi:MAG: uracil-DNA glycosylase family protein [Cohaesibacter sp.]|nr:uracil-DNA glycosylase family protein [Cohaesibacter sp.]
MQADKHQNDLQALHQKISSCRLCRDEPISTPLPHEPNPVVRLSSTARICIAGQAPGIRVHESSIPFNDPSGDRLRQWMGIDRDIFYDEGKIAIVPMGFCFPGWDAKGGDLPPRKECKTQWHDQLFTLMPQIELLLVIGQYAQNYHMKAQKKKNLTETVRHAVDIWHKSQKPRLLALPHPSWRNSGWLKRNPWFEEQVLPLLRREVKQLTA